VPAYLSAQSVRKGATGVGWSEFSGIPVTPPAKQPFAGLPASCDSGKNFRFIEFHWADILQRHHKLYGSPPDKWAPALLYRLKNYRFEKPWLPDWAMPVLEQIVKIALPVHRLLMFRAREIGKKVFEDFLGDVHLYGDYERTRGRAVRRFHVMLDEAMLRDFMEWRWRMIRLGTPKPVYAPPTFTIIAHSLGSIMCFDALMYAYANLGVRRSDNPHLEPCRSVPFLGYTHEELSEPTNWGYIVGGLRRLRAKGRLDDVEGLPPRLRRVFAVLAPPLRCAKKSDKLPPPPLCPPLLWRGHVRNFITMGSPIDKYLVLWFNKYLHMGLRNKDGDCPCTEWKTGEEKWLNRWAIARTPRIEHYNFCDRQDPVGHRLDVARATVNYSKVFVPGTRMESDVLFNRYGHPGWAHNEYWNDRELFAKIVREILDPKPAVPGAGGPRFAVVTKKAEWLAGCWIWGVPVAAVVLTLALAGLGYWQWREEAWVNVGLAGVAVVLLWVKPGILPLLCRLMVSWRRIAAQLDREARAARKKQAPPKP
jgi:hypothetical protein